jgi:haloalkane dehalogenase
MQTKHFLSSGLTFLSVLGVSACSFVVPADARGSAPQAAAQGSKKEGLGYKLPPARISAEFPFESKYLTVRGSRMHYVDEGRGEPVIFIHGNPTSSYLWRNIIPYVTDRHRAIAIDLIGMGKSDKPDIGYTFREHYDFVETFIEQQGLRNVTLVVHDWGATLGFWYASRHPDRVKAIAFMEGVLPPAFPQPSYEAMGEDMGGLFRTLKDPVKGREMVIDNNGFVEQLLPAFTNRPLGDAEMAAYRAPYTQPANRKPTLVWPLEIPVGGQPPDTTATLQAIDAFMAATELPILLLYASPGAVVSPAAVPWYEGKIKNLESVYIGTGLHFLQEDQPEAIGRALKEWLRRKR